MASAGPLIAALRTTLQHRSEEDRINLLRTLPASVLNELTEFSSSVLSGLQTLQNKLQKNSIFDPAIRAIFDRMIKKPESTSPRYNESTSPRYNLWRLTAAPLDTLSYNKLEEAEQFFSHPDLSMAEAIKEASPQDVKALLLASSQKGATSLAKATLSACLAKAAELDTESHEAILQTLNAARTDLLKNPDHYQECAQIVQILAKNVVFQQSISKLPEIGFSVSKSNYISSLLGLVFGSFASINPQGCTQLDHSEFSKKPPAPCTQTLQTLFPLLTALSAKVQTSLFSPQGASDTETKKRSPLISRILSYAIAHTLFSEHYKLGQTIFNLPEIENLLTPIQYTQLQRFTRVHPSDVFEHLIQNGSPYLLFNESTADCTRQLELGYSVSAWQYIGEASRRGFTQLRSSPPPGFNRLLSEYHSLYPPSEDS